MSSEESEGDGSFRIRPLLWRSQKVDKLFYSLDHKSQKKKSKKSIEKYTNDSKEVWKIAIRPPCSAPYSYWSSLGNC